ncbi:MAG: radical SAM protein [Candidatus Omnitrophica bacterium]|nr:radical SAM protein [Candidatus Omnitrophota bacterium]
MKIAFVNDSCERLGVGSIAAVLKANGHSVRLFTDPQLFDDENLSCKPLNRLFEYRKTIIAGLEEYNPDLIGFSVVTDFYQWACRMAMAVKSRMNVPIIFGGIHPTTVPERVIENAFVDMLCVGEGEFPVLELVESMARGNIDYSIKNLWFKKNGGIIRNPVRPLIADLDVLPPPDKEIFRQASPHFLQCYYVMASRGCSNACSYCCHSYVKKLYGPHERYVRFRGVAKVIDELRGAKQKFPMSMVRFHDDDLMAASSSWLEDFSRRYAGEVAVPFACFVHPSTVTQEKAEWLASAGCHDVELGVQSVSEKTRREIMNRNVPAKQLERAINVLKNAGLRIITDNIIGMPGQSPEENIDMLEFYNRNRVMKIYCFGFRYYPKTAIIEQARENGSLSAEDVTSLEEGHNVQAFISGGDSLTLEMRQIQTFFAFLLYLPAEINTLIIRYRLYRLMLPLPYCIAVIFSNWLRIPYRYNWALHITVCRYRYFVTGKVKRWFFSAVRRIPWVSKCGERGESARTAEREDENSVCKQCH